MVLLAAICASLSSASAQEQPTSDQFELTISSQDKVTWSQVSTAMDLCIGAMTLRGETASCRSLANFLVTFANQVAAAKPKEH